MNFFNDFFGREGNPFQKPPFTNNMGVNGMPGMNQGSNPDEPVNNDRLYNILDVKKEANDKEIRKAYLKKSTKGEYRHPDKGGDAEKFKKLVEAYDILKDETKRQDYDKYGEDMFQPNFQQKKNMSNMFNFGHQSSNNNRRKSMEKKGTPTVFNLKLTLEELCQNTTKKIRITRKVVFNKSGVRVPDDSVNIAWTSCHACNGQGVSMRIHQIRPGMIQQIQSPCDKCNRTGSIMKDNYEIKNTSEIVEIFIDKGSRNNDKITFKNKGNIIPGRQPSDLIVNIKEIGHTSYTRKENDLLIKKQITLDEALFGHKFHLFHPDGRTLSITLPSGVTPNNNLRALEGGGMPIKGDSFIYGKLFIYFEIVFPTKDQLKVHAALGKKLNDLLSMIPNYKNPVHKYDFHPNKEQLEIAELCSLDEIDMKQFGIKTKKHKNANESDSEDEMNGIPGFSGQPQCRQM
jgi:DnaJ-class molecular chaperone